MKAGRPAAHWGRLAALAQSVQRRAARHLTVRPIAEPSATDHEVLALFRRLKSGDTTGSWVSPAFIRVHAKSPRCATRADCIMTLRPAIVPIQYWRTEPNVGVGKAG